MIKNMIATFNSILLIIAIALILVHYFLDKPENNRDIAILENVSKDQFINDMKATFGTKYDYQQLSDYYDLLNPPTRATKGSAGYDFESPISFELKPGETIKIPTGIRAVIDENWVLKIYSRSSLGFKYRLWLDNLTGIIDSDYSNSDNEGHIFIKVTNNSLEDKIVRINRGDKFAQGIFVQYGTVIDDDAVEARNGGFGSTNK